MTFDILCKDEGLAIYFFWGGVSFRSGHGLGWRETGPWLTSHLGGGDSDSLAARGFTCRGEMCGLWQELNAPWGRRRRQDIVKTNRQWDNRVCLTTTNCVRVCTCVCADIYRHPATITWQGNHTQINTHAHTRMHTPQIGARFTDNWAYLRI